jgi:hypothetical protein
MHETDKQLPAINFFNREMYAVNIQAIVTRAFEITVFDFYVSFAHARLHKIGAGSDITAAVLFGREICTVNCYIFRILADKRQAVIKILFYVFQRNIL